MDPFLSRDDISVIVETAPLAIKIYHMGKPIIKRVMSESDYEAFGNPGSFQTFEVREKDRSHLILELIGRANITAILKLNLKDHLLKVTWENNSQNVDYISDTWVATEKTCWYGQGQLQHQVFPLNDYISERKPFLTRNIQASFWIAKTGVRALVDNYQLFETRFDRGITIRAMKPKTFSYSVIIGESFRDARLRFLKRIGLPEKIPNKIVFIRPVFSTWVEFKKDVDQEKVMDLVENLRKYKFPCSVIEIDDKWEEDYGDFTFDSSKFPDPKGLVNAVHNEGYLATLWVHPFINYESENYQYAKSKNYFVLDPEKDEPAHVVWWDGAGGLIDISNPEARRWFNGKLENLKKTYGFDGFKFDAGDGDFFPIARSGNRIARPIKLGRTYGGLTPNQYTDEWLRFIAENQYDLAEARVGYLAQRFGIIAREGDKESVWELDNGLHASITQALILSLIGYLYIMPDMIGGNQYGHKCNKELFVRWVEAASLMPIVQYSITPWTYDDEAVEIARRYALLHESLGDYYVSLAEKAEERGEAMLCPLVLRYEGDEGCTHINDEFMVGNLLVAPVIESGRNERTVYLPKGTWLDFWNLKEIEGLSEAIAEAPLNLLPLYIEKHDSDLIALLKRAKRKIFGY